MEIVNKPFNEMNTDELLAVCAAEQEAIRRLIANRAVVILYLFIYCLRIFCFVLLSSHYTVLSSVHKPHHRAFLPCGL